MKRVRIKQRIKRVEDVFSVATTITLISGGIVGSGSGGGGVKGGMMHLSPNIVRIK